MNRNRWYRVVGSGANGVPNRDAHKAWDSFHRAVGTKEYADRGTDIARYSARLIGATTRRAAMDADVSMTQGQVGRGEWWLIG